MPPCRICMENTMADTTNPLINPCDCKGTQGLIHIDCLREWVNTQRKIKTHSEKTIEYQWKVVSCEICKVPFPQTLQFKGRRVDILEYDQP